MKNFRLKTSGFTLIELLFIVVLLGLIMLLVVASYQQRTTNIKIDKTALQIEEILQSASFYYSDTQLYQWPSRASCNTFPTPAFESYLPAGSQISPWGTCYTYGATPDGGFAVSVDQVPQLFAYRLESFLPNATHICSGEKCQVTVVLGQASQDPLIVNIQTVASVAGGTITTAPFSCPTGWTGNARIFLVGLLANTTFGEGKNFYNDHTNRCTQGALADPLGIGAHPLTVLSTGLNNCKLIANNQYQCQFNLTSQSYMTDDLHFTNLDCRDFTWRDYGVADLTYVSFCMPPTKKPQVTL